MTNNGQLLENFEDEPDCGVNAASDKGYWLEETEQHVSDRLIEWRIKADMSPELLSKMAPIPLEEYLLIEKGERKMTNGEAWRIDAAIIAYRVSKWTWFEKSWKRGWLARCRYKLRRIWNSDTWGPIILVGGMIIFTLIIKSLPSSIAYMIGFFLGSTLSLGLPACLAVWLILYIIRGLRNTE